MAFTKAYAKIMAGMLTPEQLAAFRVACGKQPKADNISEDTIADLVELELVRRDNLIDNARTPVVILTARGKKVAEFV